MPAFRPRARFSRRPIRRFTPRRTFRRSVGRRSPTPFRSYNGSNIKFTRRVRTTAFPVHFAGRELRCIDVVSQFGANPVAADPAVSYIQPLNFIDRGTGINQRDGNTAFMRYVDIRGQVGLAASAVGTVIGGLPQPIQARVILLYVSTPLSGLPPLGSFLSDPSAVHRADSFQRPDSRQSFFILYDKIFPLSADSGTLIPGGARSVQPISVRVPIRRPVMFQDSSTSVSTVSQITSGSLFLVVVTSQMINAGDTLGYGFATDLTTRLIFDP